MSSAVLEAPPSLFAGAGVARGAGGRRVTLEERLETAWRSAQHEGVSECPLCRSAMRPEGESVRCGGCGSVVA